MSHRARRFLAGLLLLALPGAAACRSAPPENVFQEGRPRIPSDEGIVTDINFERVQLRGEATYEIDREVQSFSTYDGSVIPLLHHKDRYVQLGLDGDKRVAWIAAIGLVLQGESPTVVYNGVVLEVDEKEKRLVFEDGTVLHYTPKITALPEKGQRIKATINPAKQQVVEIAAQ